MRLTKSNQYDWTGLGWAGLGLDPDKKAVFKL